MDIQDELKEFFESEAGENLIGQIVLKAVNQAMNRDITFEDGKTNPGRVVEKTETWNLLDWLVKYLPHVEAAVRGCQADAAKARNRSTEVRDVLFALQDILQKNAFSEISLRPPPIKEIVK